MDRFGEKPSQPFLDLRNTFGLKVTLKNKTGDKISSRYLAGSQRNLGNVIN